MSMTDAMIRDFGIGEQEIVLNSTVMTLIDKNRVTLPLASLYAKQSYNQEATHFLSESELTSIFMTSNSTNIIVKYDYVNHENKHNVTIASLLVNDDECSVRFNDYIVIKREF